ncbi:MAG: RNA methyltransferase [Clostridia bacterium]|nr:RNA methyltransferase [Clostridia bacterium]
MMRYYITSRKNPIVGKINDIRSKPSEEAFLLQGEKFIYDSDPSCIKMLFVTDERKHAELIEKLPEDANLYVVTPEVMEKISGTVSPSALLAVVCKKPLPIPKKLVLLDCVQDPGNVGTVIRTAKAFGFGVICGGGADPFSEKTVRSSAGACLTAYVRKFPMVEIVENLKKHGYKIYGTALDQYSCDLETAVKDFGEKFAVIIGSEGKGMSPKLYSMCHKTLYIPIEGVESLNAAVAAGIVMYRASMKK